MMMLIISVRFYMHLKFVFVFIVLLTFSHAANASFLDRVLSPKDGIPYNKFAAYYHDRTDEKAAPIHEIVEEINISNGKQGADFRKTKGIDTLNFAGRWVGRFRFDRAEKKVFNFDFSHASVRLLVNGKGVPIVDQKAEYLFKPGTYLVEVIYINNWHTLTFRMSMQNERKSYSDADLAKFFSDIQKSDYELHVVGLYESSSSDGAVVVDIGKSKTPIVLLLSSHSAVDWRVSNTSKRDILGVVLSSHSPVTNVSSVDDNVPVLLAESRWSLHDARHLKAHCSCFQGYYRCSSYKDILTYSDAFQNTFGKGIDAYDLQHRATLTAPYRNNLIDNKEEILLRRKEAEAKSSNETCP